MQSSSRRAAWRALLTATVAALVSVGLLPAAASQARSSAKPSIRLVTAGIADSRVVAKVAVSRAPTGARWKLRVDGKQQRSVPKATRWGTSGFLAPGTHKVQALLVTRRGAPLSVSATRSVYVNVSVAAAGDIACDPNQPGYAGTGTVCHQRQTAALLGKHHYHAVFTLGDEQYECGVLDAYKVSYGSTWGKYQAITHPSAGDHEYGTTKVGCPKGTNASGYFAYWGAKAGDPTKGYYSYDLGGWHVVVLNSNCADIGGCGKGSPQEQWLAADLAAHPSVCTAAYWHEPRFTSGLAGDATTVDALWRDLYAAHADLVLNGHAHVYERFAPQNPDGVAAPDGITEIVVGTGGRSLSGFGPPAANSVVRQSSTFGILSLTLGKSSFSWRFVPEAGSTFADSGTTACH